MNTMRKTHVDLVAKAAGRTRTFVITDGSVDRDSDIINPDGWDFSDWLRNPVVLAFHDYQSWPIGRGSNLRRRGNAWLADCEFAPTPEGDTALALVDAGMLNGCSVGFQPLESTRDAVRGGTNFIRQTLLEWSLTPIPANPNALVQRAQQLGLSAAVVRKMFGGRSAVKDDAVILTLADGPRRKSGRVPSSANEVRVRKAQQACRDADSHLQTVLAELGDDDAPIDASASHFVLRLADAPEPTITFEPRELATAIGVALRDGLRDSVKAAVHRELARRRGDVDAYL